MFAQAFTIGLLMLMSAMLPGPDFAIVAKNTVLHSRRSGLFTSLGVAAACLIHMSYCIMGVALVISQSILLFSIIKYIGATYLIYLGVTSLLAKQPASIETETKVTKKSTQGDAISFRQGFFTNILNPKATLFFLALFTVIIKPETPRWWEVFYAAENFLIILIWFSSLTLLLSHPRVMRLLDNAEKHISKVLGVFLIGFGIALAFIKK